MHIHHSSASATPGSILVSGAVLGSKASVQWLVRGLAAGVLGLAAQSALAITVYDITRIGLYDAGHTDSSTGYQYNSAQFLNAVGQVAGHARIYTYNDDGDLGQSAWLYNGNATQRSA